MALYVSTGLGREPGWYVDRLRMIFRLNGRVDYVFFANESVINSLEKKNFCLGVSCSVFSSSHTLPSSHNQHNINTPLIEAFKETAPF